MYNCFRALAARTCLLRSTPLSNIQNSGLHLADDKMRYIRNDLSGSGSCLTEALFSLVRGRNALTWELGHRAPEENLRQLRLLGASASLSAVLYTPQASSKPLRLPERGRYNGRFRQWLSASPCAFLTASSSAFPKKPPNLLTSTFHRYTKFTLYYKLSAQLYFGYIKTPKLVTAANYIQSVCRVWCS